MWHTPRIEKPSTGGNIHKPIEGGVWGTHHGSAATGCCCYLGVVQKVHVELVVLQRSRIRVSIEIAHKTRPNRRRETECLMVVKIQPVQILVSQHDISTGYDTPGWVSMTFHVQADIWRGLGLQSKWWVAKRHCVAIRLDQFLTISIFRWSSKGVRRWWRGRKMWVCMWREGGGLTMDWVIFNLYMCVWVCVWRYVGN